MNAFETKGGKHVKQWMRAILYFCKKGFLNSIVHSRSVFSCSLGGPTLCSVYTTPCSYRLSFRTKNPQLTQRHAASPRDLKLLDPG